MYVAKPSWVTSRLEANDQETHLKNHYQSLWDSYNLLVCSELHDVSNYANSLPYFKNILRILWILTSNSFKLEWRAHLLHIQAVPFSHFDQKTGYPDWRFPLFISVTPDKRRNSRDYTYLRSATVPVSIEFNTVTLHRSYKTWVQPPMLWTQTRYACCAPMISQDEYYENRRDLTLNSRRKM